MVYPKVMAGHIALMIRDGDSLGRPILKPEDQVPDSRSVYVLNPQRQANPDSTRVHHALTFLRAVPVNGAVEVVKNMNLRPIQVKARDMPNGIAFNNFVQVACIHDCFTNKCVQLSRVVCAQVNNSFHVVYCDKEGLSKTSVLAWQVYLYLFYGTYSTKKR